MAEQSQKEMSLLEVVDQMPEGMLEAMLVELKKGWVEEATSDFIPTPLRSFQAYHEEQARGVDSELGKYGQVLRQGLELFVAHCKPIMIRQNRSISVTDEEEGMGQILELLGDGQSLWELMGISVEEMIDYTTAAAEAYEREAYDEALAMFSLLSVSGHPGGFRGRCYELHECRKFRCRRCRAANLCGEVSH